MSVTYHLLCDLNQVTSSLSPLVSSSLKLGIMISRYHSEINIQNVPGVVPAHIRDSVKVAGASK